MCDFVSISSAMSILADLATFIGIPVAIINIRLYIKERQEEIDAERKKKTLDYYQDRLHDTLVSLDRRLDEFEIFGGRFGQVEVSGERLAKEAGACRLVQEYLIKLEPFATGINTGVYDLNMFDRLYGENILFQKRAVWDFVKYERRRWGFTELYREYEAMISSLEQAHKGETSLAHPNDKAKLPR